MVEHLAPADALPERVAEGRPATYVVDTVLGAAGQAAAVAGAVARPLAHLVSPVARFALRPPGVPARAQPGTWVDDAARRGVVLRAAAAQGLASRIDAALPVIASTLDGHADLTEIVRGHVDLVTVATELVAEIDLPEIIRGSTGAIGSETVQGVRQRSMSADDALGRAMDRLRARRTNAARSAPGNA